VKAIDADAMRGARLLMSAGTAIADTAALLALTASSERTQVPFDRLAAAAFRWTLSSGGGWATISELYDDRGRMVFLHRVAEPVLLQKPDGTAWVTTSAIVMLGDIT
jgi:hypothetical protein